MNSREREEACELAMDHSVNLRFDNGISLNLDTMMLCLLNNTEVFEIMVKHRFNYIWSGFLVDKIMYYRQFWALELIMKRPDLEERHLEVMLWSSIKGHMDTEFLEMVLEHPLVNLDSRDGNKHIFVAIASQHNSSRFLRLLLDHPETSYRNLVAKNSREIQRAGDALYDDAIKLLSGSEESFDHRPCMVFILLVCLCDGYLEISSHEPMRRFFKIGMSLPLELQMLLSNLLYRVPKSTISTSSVNRSLGYMLKKGIL